MEILVWKLRKFTVYCDTNPQYNSFCESMDLKDTRQSWFNYVNFLLVSNQWKWYCIWSFPGSNTTSMVAEVLRENGLVQN